MSDEVHGLSAQDQMEIIIDVMNEGVERSLRSSRWNPDDVLECSQEVLLTLWLRVLQGHVPSNIAAALRVGNRALLRGWVWRSLTNALIDRRRKNNAQKRGGGAVIHLNNEQTSGIDQLSNPNASSIDEQLTARTALATFESISGLEPVTYEVLQYHAHGYSHDEIAEMLGISVEMSRQHKSKGMKRARELRSELLDDWGDD